MQNVETIASRAHRHAVPGWHRGLLTAFVRNKLHVVSFALVAVWSWARMIGTPLVTSDLVVVPSIVFATYQWNRLTDPDEDAINCPDDLANAQQHALAIRLACAASIVLGVGLAAATGRHLAAILPAACIMLGFAYSSRLRIGKQLVRLKAHFFLKNASGALGWTTLTVLYPGLHAGMSLTAPLCLGTILMFFGVVGVELVWDLRDAVGDRQAGIQSLPVLVGAEGVRRVGYALGVGGALLIASSVLLGWVPGLWLVTLVNAVVICGWLRTFGTNTNRVWSDVLVAIQTALLFGMGILA